MVGGGGNRTICFTSCAYCCLTLQAFIGKRFRLFLGFAFLRPTPPSSGCFGHSLGTAQQGVGTAKEIVNPLHGRDLHSFKQVPILIQSESGACVSGLGADPFGMLLRGDEKRYELMSKVMPANGPFDACINWNSLSTEAIPHTGRP